MPSKLTAQTLATLCAVFLGSWAAAQDIDRIRPVVPNRVDPTSATATPLEDDEALSIAEGPGIDEKLATIRGIILLSDPDQATLETPPSVSGITIQDDSLVVPEEAKVALEKFINGPLSLRTIDEISRDTVLAYRAADLPVVDVGFPEQEITTGVLQMVIIVGRAGEVKVEGNHYFDDQIYLRSLRTTPGDILYETPLLDDLNYLNRNPYRDVNLAYTPGESFGEADLILRAEERRPFTLYSGYEDTGNTFLGEDRLFAGFEWGNVGGWDHILGYQYTTTTDFDRLHAHSASYRIPFYQTRHELQLLAGYVEVDNAFILNGANFQNSGESVQLSGNYVIPMPDVKGYSHELFAGYDFKSTNNNLEFGGTQVTAANAEIHQFSVGQTFNKKQSYGQQILTHRLVYSPGNLTDQNSDASFAPLRAGADADYAYWSAEFTQRIDLPAGCTAIANLEGQISSENLLPSESLILGGIGSVRGFEQNITRADQGAVLNLELYAPPISLLKKNDSARAFAFYDQAWAGNVNLLPNEPSHIQLGGIGLGVDFRLARNFSTRASYGWKIDAQGFQDDASHGRFHVFTSLRW